MRMFLRKTGGDRDPLLVAMSGVRRGERVLQVGVNDPVTAALVALKAGLSGHAALVVSTDAARAVAAKASAEAGATLDIQVAPFDRLPFPDESFDVTIVNSADGLLEALAATRPALLAEVRRVTRPGGRVVTVERGTPAGLLARFSSKPAVPEDYAAAGGTPGSLEAAGFKPVRELADLEGLRFVEGFRR